MMGEHLTKSRKAGGQSRRHSALEAALNVGIGYGVAVVATALILPLFSFRPSISDSMGISAMFTAVSLARSYALRRLFNRWQA